jgi:hypothetical protein
MQVLQDESLIVRERDVVWLTWEKGVHGKDLEELKGKVKQRGLKKTKNSGSSWCLGGRN